MREHGTLLQFGQKASMTEPAGYFNLIFSGRPLPFMGCSVSSFHPGRGPATGLMEGRRGSMRLAVA